MFARVAWAERWPRAALMLADRDHGLLMQLGNYYFGAGGYDLKKSEQAYRKALRDDSRALWGHYQLARIYFVEGKFGPAIAEINAELEANPENLRALYVRGLAEGFDGDLPAAEADFRRFILWAPKEWAGYNDLAWILAKEGKYSEAEKISRAAIHDVPGADQNPWLWNSLGAAYLNQGKVSKAEGAFEQARDAAARITESEWRKAYPGNDPAEAQSGIFAFRAAVADNLKNSRR